MKNQIKLTLFLFLFSSVSNVWTDKGWTEKLVSRKKAPAAAAKTPSRQTRRERTALNLSVMHSSETVHTREPLDLLNLIPVVRDINRMIPRQFSLAEHDVRLSPDKVIIEHH